VSEYRLVCKKCGMVVPQEQLDTACSVICWLSPHPVIRMEVPCACGSDEYLLKVEQDELWPIS